jgi:hypothetical protein
MHPARAPIAFLLSLTPTLLAIAVACGGKDDPCLPIAPGVAVFEPGIDLLVRDASGRGEALHDTSITYQGVDSTYMVSFDTLHLMAGFGRPGAYAVRVKRPYYRDAVIPGITVAQGQCGGTVTVQVPVTLQLVAGVRSPSSAAASWPRRAPRASSSPDSMPTRRCRRP